MPVKKDYVKTINLVHTSSIGHLDAGIAKAGQVCLGMRTGNLVRVLCGLRADGGLINVTLSDHLLQQFWGTFEFKFEFSAKWCGVGLGQGVHHRKDTETV